jgi:hypothetical protein
MKMVMLNVHYLHIKHVILILLLIQYVVIYLPLQSSPFQNDQPQLSAPNQNFEHFHQHGFTNNHYQQQQQQQPSISFTVPPESRHAPRETGKNIY